MDEVVTLPGGFRVDGKLVREVTFREMSGAEEEIIVDRRRAEGGKGKSLKSASDRMSEILSRCTVRIGDVVSETNRASETAKVETFWNYWHSALTGDRGVAITRLRQLSLGDKYVFPESCPHCKHEMRRVTYDLSEATVAPYFKWIEEDILKEHGADELTDEMREEAENRRLEMLLKDEHEIILPGKKHVVYHLLHRIDEDRVQDALEKNQEAVLSALIAAHISSIDGVKVNSLKDPRIRHMSTRDRDFLRIFFDRAGGGLDTWMEVHCDNIECGAVFNRKLNVGHPSFFIRSEA